MMMRVESWLLGYLVNSLWMVPLVFVAAWAAARAVRRAGPQAEHKVWVTALLVEALLPGMQLRWGAVLQVVGALLRMWRWGAKAGGGEVSVSFITMVAPGHEGLWLSHRRMVLLVTMYVFCVCYFAAKLAWGLWKAYAMRREAWPVAETGPVAERWAMHCSRAEVEGAVLLASEKVQGPATVGMRRVALLAPLRFFDEVEEGEMDAVMAHECAHMRRRDFAKNVLYNVAALPVAFHPLLWLTRVRMVESREMVCDAMAAEAVAGQERYARSLLRLASLMVAKETAGTFHAIGIFDANCLERRVMKLMRRRENAGRVLRLAMLGACVTIGAVACASALALRVDVGSRSGSDSAKAGDQTQRTMPVLVWSKKVEYPQVAKESRINGNCLVALTVNRMGEPEGVHVVKSLQPEYDAKAVQAVQQYRFKPATKDGEPVAKTIRVEVTFKVF